MGKNKLYVLIGKSGSGKSTIEQEVDRLGVAHKIISTTTRKKRSYEINSVDYYFISQTVFNIYLKQGQYAEHSTYPTVWGDASYGINKNDIRLDEGNAIAVVNPHGYYQLVKNLGKENVIGIYIERDDRERILSAIKRDNSSNLKSILAEVLRRLETDEVDFANIKNDVDYVIENNVLSSAITRVLKIIENESK